MHASIPARLLVAAALGLAAAGCRGDKVASPEELTVVPKPPATMTVLGRGNFTPARTTAEIAVRGTTAYTTTWGNPAAAASVFYIWNVAGDQPLLVDSVRVDNATTLGDVAVTDDGALLVIATERANGGLAIYSLADPRRPVLVSRYVTPRTSAGVHTAEVGRVNGRQYAFLSIDQGAEPARIVIVDLGNPAAPVEVYTKLIGNPFVHDTFVRDGLLFLALWDDGVAIWDIGGGNSGGTPAVPVELGRVRTVNGNVHNVWWLKDPVTNNARFALIGEESAIPGASSAGDIHVVDIGTRSAPREVAYYRVPGAGTHNFSVDEASGILYAAYYNGGVRAIDVRGDLGTCTTAQKSQIDNATLLCDLRLMGRELGIGLLDRPAPVQIWGVQYQDGAVYASDMRGGIWKLKSLVRASP